jgi:muconolactone D-isomerase
MLYLVNFHIDQQALGFGAQREAVVTAEGERALALRQAGRLVGFWARADLGGVICILDAESHEDLMQELRTLPLFPFFRSIDVTPLATHRWFPEFGASPAHPNRQTA